MARSQRKPKADSTAEEGERSDDNKYVLALLPYQTYQAFVMHCVKSRIRSRKLEAGRIIGDYLKEHGYGI